MRKSGFVILILQQDLSIFKEALKIFRHYEDRYNFSLYEFLNIPMIRGTRCRKEQIPNLSDYPPITVILAANRRLSTISIYHCIMHYTTK